MKKDNMNKSLPLFLQCLCYLVRHPITVLYAFFVGHSPFQHIVLRDTVVKMGVFGLIEMAQFRYIQGVLFGFLKVLAGVKPNRGPGIWPQKDIFSCSADFSFLRPNSIAIFIDF
jgi:hypothetical protein